MDAEQKVGAVQLSTRLRGVSPQVTGRLRVAEQTSLAELHAALQVAFGMPPPRCTRERLQPSAPALP
jgi:hypothetical protein